MQELFNKSILNKLYDCITEDFEQDMYKQNNKVKEIEGSIHEKAKIIKKY